VTVLGENEQRQHLNCFAYCRRKACLDYFIVLGIHLEPDRPPISFILHVTRVLEDHTPSMASVTVVFGMLMW